VADDFDRARMQMQDDLLCETRLCPARGSGDSRGTLKGTGCGVRERSATRPVETVGGSGPLRRLRG
jgi:hypothetical protein